MKNFIIICFLFSAGFCYADQADDILSEAVFAEDKLYPVDRQTLDSLNISITESVNESAGYKARDSEYPNPESYHRALRQALGHFGYQRHIQLYSPRNASEIHEQIAHQYQRQQQKIIYDYQVSSAFENKARFLQKISNMYDEETQRELLKRSVKNYSHAIEYFPDKQDVDILVLLYMRSVALFQLGDYEQAKKSWQEIKARELPPVKTLLIQAEEQCSKGFNSPNEL